MSEPAWMKWVVWPDCKHCLGKGFYVDAVTNWPTECRSCESARKDAIKRAQSHQRKERKEGRV